MLRALEVHNDASGIAHSYLQSDNHRKLRQFLAELPRDERAAVLTEPSLLFDALADEADQCVELLLTEYGESVAVSGEALGVAAQRGQVDVVRRLLAAGADPNQPAWEHDCDFDTLLTGAMQSMHPEIVTIACSPENFAQLEVGWLNEALALGLSSRKKKSFDCLTVFGQALLVRLETGELAHLTQGDLKKLSRRLARSKAANAESIDIGQALASHIGAKAA
ncbi:MAG: hypothetical protein AAF657_18900, partial [Acidobacteriota bacterium]